MEGLLFITLATLVGCTVGVPSVVRFDMEKQVQQKVRLQQYKFRNCLPAAKEMAVVNNLSFNPDPLLLPGTLNVSFDLTVKEKVSAPVKTVVYLGKKVGSTWIKIPCIGSIGSCTYADICQILKTIQECPPALVAVGVNCTCPINVGKYHLPPSYFDVDGALFPTGDYHAQVNMTIGKFFVGCYDLQFSFE